MSDPYRPECITVAVFQSLGPKSQISELPVDLLLFTNVFVGFQEFDPVS